VGRGRETAGSEQLELSGRGVSRSRVALPLSTLYSNQSSLPLERFSQSVDGMRSTHCRHPDRWRDARRWRSERTVALLPSSSRMAMVSRFAPRGTDHSLFFARTWCKLWEPQDLYGITNKIVVPICYTTWRVIHHLLDASNAKKDSQLAMMRRGLDDKASSGLNKCQNYRHLLSSPFIEWLQATRNAIRACLSDLQSRGA